MKKVIKISEFTHKLLQKKLREAQEELQQRKTQRTMRLAETSDMLDHGQGEFDQKLEQRRVDDLEKLYDSCIPIENPTQFDRITLGHKVTLQKGNNVITLVIDGIALNSKMMSTQSEIGRAMLGKKVGDIVNSIEIKKIESA